MKWSSGNPERRTFRVRYLVAAVLTVVFAIVAARVFLRFHPHGVAACLLAILPALPILWVLIETGRFLAVERDEFQRHLMAQCLLGGIGGTLAVTTVWGYMEDFAHAPRLDLIYIYPIFWLFVCIAWPVVYRRYR